MPSRAALRERIDLEVAEDWTLTVAISRDGIIGFIAIKPNSAILDQLFVAPEAIGLGIGRALLTVAMVAMPGGFVLHTASSNQRARCFYEKSGLTLHLHGLHPRTGHPVSFYRWPGAA